MINSPARIRRDRFAMKSTEGFNHFSNTAFNSYSKICNGVPIQRSSQSTNRDFDSDKMYNAMEKGHKVTNFFL